MEGREYGVEELSALVDRLQAQVTQHQKVQRELGETRHALDRELARLKVAQAYNDRALRVGSAEELTALSLEAMVDAFELEAAAMFRCEPPHSQLHRVGELNLRACPPLLPFDPGWLGGEDCPILEPGHPLLTAWSELPLEQVILCPLLDPEGQPFGVMLGARLRGGHFDPFPPEMRAPFRVMAQQVGAHWLNYHLNVTVRERKYSVLFHRSNDGILLVDLDGQILDTNQRALEMFGYDREAMLRMKVFELTPAEEAERSRALFAQLTEAGSLRFERDCVRADGTRFPAEVSASLFELDGRTRVHGLIRDITERRRAERQLLLNERMAALGQLVAGVAHEINTPVGVIRASIANIESALHHTLERLPPLLRSLEPPELESLLRLLDRARRDAPILSSREAREHRRRLRDELEAMGAAAPEEVADLLVDIGILDDLETLAPLLRADRREALEAAYSIASLRRNNDNIATAAERAAKVTFALKKLAHHDERGQRTPTDVIDSLETVVTLYASDLKQGVTVIRHFDPLPPIPCYADELGQIWTNLIHNALQAMGRRGTLELSARMEGDAVVVAVADDGPGVPEAVRDRIFEPFFTTKTAGEGSGLGLDICRRIAERHGGRIEFESRPGRTVFRVWLPVEEGGGGEDA